MAELDAQTGHVAESVDALVSALEAPPGTLADSLGSLACSTARLVDLGQPQAVAQLRLTLEALDEAARITERDSGEEWFTCFDIWCALTGNGLRRESEVGRAMARWLAQHPAMSQERPFMPWDRPWACPKCGHRGGRGIERVGYGGNGAR
jgi:hypothetical protein